MADAKTPAHQESDAGNDAAVESAKKIFDEDYDDFVDEEDFQDPVLPPPRIELRPETRARRLGRVNLLLYGVVMVAVGTAIGVRVEKRRRNPVVVTINGSPVLADEFLHAAQIPSGKATMKRLIDEKLTIQFATERRLLPDAKAVDAEYAKHVNEPDFFKKLRNANLSVDDYKHALLVTLCEQAIVDNGVSVSDADIAGYYRQNTDKTHPGARFYHAETVVIQVVITKAKDEIDKAWHEVKSGTPFATVVAKYSKDTSRRNGGVFPPIHRGVIKEDKLPGFEHLVFDSVNPGTLIPPKQFAGAYWIIQCVSHTPESIDDLDKVRDQCRQAVLFEKGMQANGVQLKRDEEAFARKASISVNLPQYQEFNRTSR